MMAIGHPILGDRLYGTNAAIAKSRRLLLHANILSFNQPLTGVPVYVEIPPDF
jgi:tRNA pseudouridine32 synthase/23S rRNA pseudouridine746 synthase